MAGSPSSESELIAGCRDGDPRAAEEIVRRHQAVLGRIVERLVGRRSVAEEIVQETFLKTFADIDRVDPKRGLRGWLLRVAVNQARMHLRKRSTRTEVVASPRDDDAPLFARSRDLEQETVSAEERRRLLGALDRLSPKLREIVVLHYVEEMSLPEISRALGTPVPALKMRALRARSRLFDLLGSAR